MYKQSSNKVHKDVLPDKKYKHSLHLSANRQLSLRERTQSTNAVPALMLCRQAEINVQNLVLNPCLKDRI